MPQHEDSDGDIKGSENKPNTLNEQMTAWFAISIASILSSVFQHLPFSEYQ